LTLTIHTDDQRNPPGSFEKRKTRKISPLWVRTRAGKINSPIKPHKDMEEKSALDLKSGSRNV